MEKKLQTFENKVNIRLLGVHYRVSTLTSTLIHTHMLGSLRHCCKFSKKKAMFVWPSIT